MSRCVRRLGTEKADGEVPGRKENQRARALYEEIFPEDDRAFVDYYFQVKAEENEIYVVEETQTDEILATLHLNPYPVQFCRSRVDTAYIVAVSTREDCRHQGLMTSLLKASLCRLYEKKSPFAWLMPAAEAIYYPFGFRFIYQKNQMRINRRMSDGDRKAELSCRIAEEQDLEELEAFAAAMLPNIAQVYAVHDREYFAQRLQELNCEGGSLVLYCVKGRICGYFLASVREKQAWEIVVEQAYEAEAKDALLDWFGLQDSEIKITAFPPSWELGQSCMQVPAVMGRIVHLEQFVQGLCSPEEKEWQIHLQDDLIAENNGTFRISVGRTGGSLVRLAECGPDVREMGIGTLMEEIFDVSVWLNEVV